MLYDADDGFRAVARDILKRESDYAFGFVRSPYDRRVRDFGTKTTSDPRTTRTVYRTYICASSKKSILLIIDLRAGETTR